MPITKSAKKALRVSDRKRVFNLRRKKNIEHIVRDVKKLIKEKKTAEAEKLLPQVYKAFDKAVKGNTLKKNTASRKKSRIASLIKNSKK